MPRCAAKRRDAAHNRAEGSNLGFGLEALDAPAAVDPLVSSAAATLRVRSTARALLVTPAREILLVRYVAHAIGRRFWITPGGGIEAGETEREAAAREVHEETGLAEAPIGPAVWTRSVPIPWAEPPFLQRETYFWTPTPRFEPSAASIPTDSERSEIAGYRWWRIEEIEASPERFAPRRLAALLRDLFERGLPASPVEAE